MMIYMRKRIIIELFSLFVNSQMMIPFFTTRTISESNRIVGVFIKKDSQVLYYSNRL